MGEEAHQGHHLGELGNEVQGEDGPEDGSPPERITQRFGIANGGVEGWALVIDAKGDELDDELDQEAHRVDQVGLEVCVRLLHLILFPPSSHILVDRSKEPLVTTCSAEMGSTAIPTRSKTASTIVPAQTWTQ